MALVAMFAFSTMASAQFGLGGLMKKKKKAVECEVVTWKTGDKVTLTNPFSEDPKTMQQLYSWEENFSDKAMKAKIQELFMDDEAFNNKKRAAGEVAKDRKIFEILYSYNDWRIVRDDYDVPRYRYINFYVISGLQNGLVVAEEYVATNKYQGGGTYADTMTFELYNPVTRSISGTATQHPHRWLITDWVYKPAE